MEILLRYENANVPGVLLYHVPCHIYIAEYQLLRSIFLIKIACDSPGNIDLLFAPLIKIKGQI
jgi:hypothetical protein